MTIRHLGDVVHAASLARRATDFVLNKANVTPTPLQAKCDSTSIKRDFIFGAKRCFANPLTVENVQPAIHIDTLLAHPEAGIGGRLLTRP